MQKLNLENLMEELKEKRQQNYAGSIIMTQLEKKLNEIIDWINDHENTFIKK